MYVKSIGLTRGVRLLGIAFLSTLLLAAVLAPSRALASGDFTLQSKMNNKCLEITGFSNDNGAKVGMWDCWGGANQRWYWDGDRIRNKFNNKCLEIYALSNDNGARAGMWDCWGGANQEWYWDGDQIRSKFNNKCLEITFFNNDNGAQAGMWDCWGGANQRWYAT